MTVQSILSLYIFSNQTNQIVKNNSTSLSFQKLKNIQKFLGKRIYKIKFKLKDLYWSFSFMFLLYFKDNKKRDDMIMIIEKLLLYWILSCL